MSVTQPPFDDARIAALVDGELAPADAAALEAAAAADPALAARIEQARALCAAVAGAFAGALAEPSPPRLLATIRGGATVVDLGATRARRPPKPMVLTAARWGAIAASLAVAFYAGRLLAPAQPPAAILSGPGGLVADGALAGSLDTQLASNQSADAPVKIGVSFRANDGDYCRTFMLRQAKPVAGLACREAGGWRVRVAALSPPPAPEAGYRTAGAETPAPVLETMDQLIAGAPLDAAGEARAKAAGWRGPK
jgi:hypothetical protein